MNEPRYVEKATTQHEDWVGSAAADNPQEGVVEEALGIDPNRYAVVGLSLFAGWGDFHPVTAYVVDRGDLPDRAALEAAAEVPVLEVTDLQMTSAEMLAVMKQFSIRITVRLANQRLRIERSLSYSEFAGG